MRRIDRRFLARTGSAAALTLFLSTAAQAGVTAGQVWQSLVDLSAASGGRLTATGQKREGDTLVVSGIGAVTAADPSALRLTVPELRLRDMGDGRVEITMAKRMSASVAAPDWAVGAGRTTVDIVQKGLSIIASGEADDMSLDAEIAEVEITTDKSAAAQFAVTATEGKGNARVAGTTTRTMDSDLTFAMMGFDVATVAETDAAGALHTTGSLNGVKLTNGLQLPAGTGGSDMAAALKAGYRITNRLRFASGNIGVDLKEADGTTNIQAGLADGDLTASLGRDGMGYALVTGASRAVLQLPALPVPAEVGLSEVRLTASGPVEPGVAAQPFAAAVKLAGLNLSEGVWGIFDPSSVLPRDPMTLVLDLAGKARLSGGLFDAATADAGTLPVELETVSLNELRLSGLGAEITGKGAATLTGGGEQPIPVGVGDFQMKGLNGLIEKLVGMSLLPQEEAMGLRMSLALFTVPTGEDSAKSRVEADADGNVRVNGQVLYKFPKSGSAP